MNNKETSYSLGMRAEQIACDFIVRKGYRIIERNYRIKDGEIDIIARYGRDLVFIEVKMKKSVRFGYPEESVSRTKLLRVCKAIKDYIAKKRYLNATYRFDIISIIYHGAGSTPDILHLENIELPFLLS